MTSASPANSSSFNNTTSRLNTSVTGFVSWFVHGVTLVIELVFVVLVVGGVLNYVLVGRKRGEWTPDQSEGLRPPGPGTVGPPTPPSSGGT